MIKEFVTNFPERGLSGPYGPIKCLVGDHPPGKRPSVSEELVMNLHRTIVEGAAIAAICLAVVTPPVHADPPYWHRVSVDFDPNGEECGQYCQLAFDPNGDPIIAYEDGYGNLTLARPGPAGIDGEWDIQIIDPAPYPLGYPLSTFCKLAIQPSGYPAIAFLRRDPMDPNDPYDDTFSLRYKSQSEEGWSLSEPLSHVLSMSTWWPLAGTRPPGGLAYDGNGDWWISYVFSGLVGGDIQWATPFEPILHPPLDKTPASTGVSLGSPYLAVGPSGWPSVVYWYSEPIEPWYHGIKYGSFDPNLHSDPNYPSAYSDPTSWRIEGMWPGDVHPGAFVFDPNGAPRVLGFWQDDETGKDWLAFNTGAEWDRYVTDQVTPWYTDLGLAYRHDGNPGISFYDGRDAHVRPLRYAWGEPGSPNWVWHIRDVDWIGDTGEFHSLASDANGLPAIAYFDATEKRLMYAVTSDVPDTYTLTVDKKGQGDGTVERDPNEDPNWGAYVYGTVVTLTGVPDDKSTFKHWLIYDPNYPGDANYAKTKAQNPIEVVMDRNWHVTAVFGCSTGSGLALPVLLAALALGLVKARARVRRA